MNVTAASSVTVDGLVVISLLCVDALGERTSLGLGNIIGRKTSSKMDGIQGELKNQPVARRSIPTLWQQLRLQSQDPMVKKKKCFVQEQESVPYWLWVRKSYADINYSMLVPKEGKVGA